MNGLSLVFQQPFLYTSSSLVVETLSIEKYYLYGGEKSIDKNNKQC